MDISTELLYRIYMILFGSGVVCLALRYLYVKATAKKSFFQKPISYVEIRTWREKQ